MQKIKAQVEAMKAQAHNTLAAAKTQADINLDSA